MEDYAPFVLCVEALVRIALVIVEVIGDGYLGIETTGQNDFEEIQLTKCEFLARQAFILNSQLEREFFFKIKIDKFTWISFRLCMSLNSISRISVQLCSLFSSKFEESISISFKNK